MSKASINSDISHEDFITTINEEKKYRELKRKNQNDEKSKKWY